MDTNCHLLLYDTQHIDDIARMNANTLLQFNSERKTQLKLNGALAAIVRPQVSARAVQWHDGGVENHGDRCVRH